MCNDDEQKKKRIKEILSGAPLLEDSTSMGFYIGTFPDKKPITFLKFDQLKRG